MLVQFQGEVYAGQLIAWRKDRDQNTEKGLVRFQRAGHQVELWFPKGQIRVSEPDDRSTDGEQWSSDAVNRLLSYLEDDQK